jgi:ADP-heptose:LPS heptosyltransferase
LTGYSKKHVVDYYLDLLKYINIEPKQRKVEIFLNEAQKKRASLFWQKNGISDNDLVIIISPCGGISWGKDSFRKHWDKKKFAHLADRLKEAFGAKIIFSSDSQEKPIIEEVEKLTHYKPIIKAVDLCLMDFLSLLAKADLLITNDGGPLHMGVGLDIKTVSVFGPVDERVYGPYCLEPNKHIVIKKDLSCRPCYKKFRLLQCPYDRKCLETIEVDEVFEAVKSLIKP